MTTTSLSVRSLIMTRARRRHRRTPSPSLSVARAAARGVCSLLLVVAAVAAAVAAAPGVVAAGAGDQQPRVRVDFKDIQLSELVFLFSSLTGHNFVLMDRDLAGKTLTVYAPRPVTLDEASELFVTALRLHGLKIERRDGFWLIMPDAGPR